MTQAKNPQRLTHSRQGFLRQMQMSSARLWLFVEGRTDQYFYSKLAEVTAAISESDMRYVVAKGDELSSSSGGGKTALLGFFDYLRAAGSLTSDLAGRRTHAVFFLDKDVDDLVRRRRRSPHIVYTEFYCVENYLFKNGDLVEAAAAALNASIPDVRAVLRTPRTWCKTVATRWLDWTKLCLAATMLGARSSPNYRVLSEVNVDTFGSHDTAKSARYKQSLLAAAPCDRRTAAQTFERCSALVERYYARRMHDRVFNGKWYAAILEHELASAFAGSVNGFRRRILPHLTQSLDFGAPWARYLRERLAGFLSQQ